MNTPFKLLESTNIPLTHDLAVEFRDMKPSPTERDLLPKRLKELQQKIETGLALPFNWATARLGEDLYRVNGGHSSNVLAGMNGAFPPDLIVHVDRYEVENPEGLAMLFRQFDPKGSARSAADVAGAYQGLEEDLAGIDKTVAKLSIEGVAWWRKEVEGLPPLAEYDVYTLFHNASYHPFLHWVHSLFGMKTPELRRKEILAAMFATWSVNQEDTKIFWDLVARGGMANDDDAPANRLDKWFENQKDKKLKVDAKPAHYYQASIFCWNAWRRDERVKTVKYDTSKGFLPPIE
jgi:hypothetical protein